MPFLSVNGHTLHYQHQQGAGSRTFVFANSLGTDLRIWDDVVELLKPHGSMLRFDKPGHGLSEVPQTPLTISDYVADVIALLDALQIGQCIFVGLSIGGVIGQRLALTYPDRIGKLVLSNTGPKIGTADSWNDRIQTVQQQGLSAIADGVMQRWFPTAFREANPTQVAAYKRMLEQTSPAGYVAACGAVRDEDLTGQIAKINVPTLCLGGTDDLATPPDLVQAMASAIPDARYELIDGAGHIPCVQMPDRVAQLILQFIHETPEQSLYEQGMKTRRAVLGDAHVDRAEAAKTDFDADFQQYITETAWGSIWSRPGLTKRERSLITIALLATLGHDDELAMHLRATRNTGASPDDVKETLLHTAIYAGVPVTNGAMKIAKAVFK
ncbi:bifunctional 3-oxoadipate enol-lactonase/4-carboxymuconolactone decarboxylase PcaDC [Fibrella forsythiae]|uniref:3-oxoadipate enol-lactonase n=1 Tax=Fibrella forsythiae TaxID=2817061 RepID=A0ABS3JPM1_9BACT|nr:3-oxoadipate enol-lactonase [Fibrella forsythiae]MBO0951933.1 3-oxoadipate enol-lactonase [Fibrella forsythiae]